MEKKPRILYIYLTPRAPMLNAYLRGFEQSTFLYGLIELRKLGYAVDFFDDAYSKFTFLNYIFRPLENIFKYAYNYPLLGFRLQQALILIPKLHHYDIIISTQDSAGLPIALLKKMGLIKAKVIYVSSNLTNALEKPRFSWIVSYLRFTLSAVEVIMCSTKKEQTILEQKLKRPVIFLADGIDIEFFKPEPRGDFPIDILAVGKDYYRDYQTLFSAVKENDWKTVVVCDPTNIRGLKVPKNVRIMYEVTSLKLRSLYAQAKLIVLPMRKTNKPQGHTVLLAVMSMGKKIIASNVFGITTAYKLKKYPLIHLVTPENSSALKQTIATEYPKPYHVLNNRVFRDSISTMHYAKSLALIINKFSRT